MTKTEFQDYIDRCDIYLREGRRYRATHALCWTLKINLGVSHFGSRYHISSILGGIFLKDEGEFWWHRTEEHIPVRLITLRLFEQVCLDEKLYEEL